MKSLKEFSKTSPKEAASIALSVIKMLEALPDDKIYLVSPHNLLVNPETLECQLKDQAPFDFEKIKFSEPIAVQFTPIHQLFSEKPSKLTIGYQATSVAMYCLCGTVYLRRPNLMIDRYSIAEHFFPKASAGNESFQLLLQELLIRRCTTENVKKALQRDIENPIVLDFDTLKKEQRCPRQEILLRHGIDSRGCMDLYNAAQHSCIPCAYKYKDQAGTVNINLSLPSALYQASYHGCKEIVELVLEKEKNILRSYEETALMKMLEGPEPDIEIAGILLGVMPGHRSKYGINALGLAKQLRKQQLIDLLSQNPIEMQMHIPECCNSCDDAIYFGHVDCIERLWSKFKNDKEHNHNILRKLYVQEHYVLEAQMTHMLKMIDLNGKKNVDIKNYLVTVPEGKTPEEYVPRKRCCKDVYDAAAKNCECCCVTFSM